MGTLLGFRRPQFSEDVAWLPAWLQQHDVESFDEHHKGLTPLEQQNEEWPFLEQHISTGKDANLSSRDDGRYQSCHLFLSGEDNSPASFAPSSENVAHFHLHLSLNGNSQNISSPPLDTSQADRLKSNNVLFIQQAETSAHHEERENPLTIDDNEDAGISHDENVGNFKVDDVSDAVDLSLNGNSQNISSPPLDTSQADRLKSNNVLFIQQAETSAHHEERENPLTIDDNEDAGISHDENVGNFKVDDVSDAVELSIAASEALVIHEIVKSGSSTKSLLGLAILEVALRVKQARLEGPEHNFQYASEDIDSLSDLDESTMNNAYEDVGLSISCFDDLCASDSIVSRVEDTPSSAYNSICNEKHIYEGHMAIEVVDTSSKQRSRDVLNVELQPRADLALESVGGERAKCLITNPGSSSIPSSVACLDGPVLQQSDLANSDVPATTEAKELVLRRVGYATMDTTSVPPQEDVNSSPRDLSPENSEKADKLTNIVQERFQSRWLGGWTLKKEEFSSAAKEHDNARRIPQFVVRGMSSLSESADIAPDENSFVQNQDKGAYMASQSSIPYEGLHNKLNETIMFSQDIVRSSCCSLVDPLCSVVPCSLTSENACSTLEQHPNDKVDAGKCFSPALIDTGEDYKSTVSRRLNSLRTYSTGPGCNIFLERESIYCNNSKPVESNSRFLSSKQNLGCSRGCIGLQSRKSMFKSIDGEIGENHEISDKRHRVTDFSNQKQNKDGNAKERRSPLILNRGTFSHFQTSKHFKPGDPPIISVPQSDILLQQNKNFQNKQSKCNISSGTEVAARKRVRFSESGFKPPQKNDLHKFQLTHKNGLTGRASKRSKVSNLHSESRANGVKRRRTNCPIKDGKRMIFQDIEFLLTGFSSQKETEIAGMIRKYGGMVLSDIPSPPNSRGKRNSRFSYQQLPVILCRGKLETIEFLYGCAVNACMLNVNWITDSIAAGSVLRPQNYMILSNHVGGKCARIGKPQLHHNKNKYMFDGVGIMFHGTHSFCTKLAKVVKHGGGHVFKTLQWLVQSLDAQKISAGAIVAEDESRASRHLKHCASEQKIPMMPARWIMNCLHEGKLLPLVENTHCSILPPIQIPVSMDLSEEI